MNPGNYIPETTTDLTTGPWLPFGSAAAAPHPTLPGFEQVTVPVDTSDRLRFVRLRIRTLPTEAQVASVRGKTCL